MPHVNTYTLHQWVDDGGRVVFRIDPPWEPVEEDPDAVDVQVTLDQGTWRDMGSPPALVVQVTPKTEGKDNGA